MFPYLSLMWVSGKVTDEKLQAYVPKVITQEEKDLIVVTPQN
ncbi:hypothetical protein [Paenibacillus glacialis]|nr:hypothetical protein [Paenibacillus glacialis]